MTTYTPFLKLALPPFDTAPWDQAVNGNMTTIDAFIARYMAVPNYVGGWQNSTGYVSGQNVLDITNATIYQCQVTHTSSAAPTTFAQDRTTYATYWRPTTNVVSGGSAMTVSDIPPATAKQGDLWFDSVSAQLYVYYNDGGSMQWVIATNTTGAISEAPNDGNIYGRQRGTWVTANPGATSNVGRNLIHNSMFNIAQRGVGPWTTSASVASTADRWGMYFSGGTQSTSIVVLSDANRAVIGDEAAVQAIQTVVTGSATAGSSNQLFQNIEGVRRLAGKTFAVSFWAWAATGTPRIGVMPYQSFGTGGGSAAVFVAGQSVLISTTPTRYSLTFTMPSSAGKVIGTAGNDLTGLVFYLSGASDQNSNTGNVGVQSGTFTLWGVQLEIAQPGQTQPTPLEKPDPELQLRQCQRFYQYGGVALYSYSTAGSWIGANAKLIEMRANPTIVFNSQSYNNASGLATIFIGAAYFNWQATVTATGAAFATAGYTASADL